MRGGFTGGRLFGIPIRINVSWFISLIVLTSLLGGRVFPNVLPDLPPAAQWALGLATALTFFLSIILHELGHALVARAFGIPVRSITLFLLGGVAQIAQEAKRPAGEFLIAAAGPAVTLALSALFFGLMLLSGGHRTPASVMFASLGLLNLSMGIFNLAPGFPMDGGRIFRALIWGISGSHRWATRIAAWTGRAFAAVLVVLGLFTIVGVRGLPFEGDSFTAISMVLIGLYLDSAARASLESMRLLEFLRDYRVGDLMLRDVPIINAASALQEFLPEMLAARDCDAAFVAEYADDGEGEGGRMVGLLPRGRAVTVPVRERARLTALDLMLPADSLRPAAPEDDAAGLLQRLEGEGLVAVPVVAGGEVLGLIGRSTLAHLLARRGRG
ncbi:MAG TPA: site-2 protease family protein [Dehalococcoidia bacterium]|nr:site-2 protease family protein [Dehalococcoidia bacterium]